MPVFEPWFIAALVAGSVSVGVAIWQYRWVNRQDPGSAKAQEVASWIREGAMSYLQRLYTGLLLAVVILGTVIAIVFSFDIGNAGGGAPITVEPILGLRMAFAFSAGAVCSAIAGYMGMTVAIAATARSVKTANQSIHKAFRLAFNAGSVVGLAMVGLAVIGMSVIYALTKDPRIVLGFSFGASTLALLAKVGGGIYTKTADIAISLVGKVEIGIPDDDPRNPAVVADNVGDNVAGMGADVFDSYVASAVAVMLLGVSAASGEQGLAINGMIVSAEAYAPIVGNAKGIAEMSGEPQEVIDTAGVLAAGNGAKAITGGFVTAAAVLTMLALLAAYRQVVNARLPESMQIAIQLADPQVVAGVLLGAMVPPLFSVLTMFSVTRNAFRMTEEIREQFRRRPGILAGREKPNYASCVGLAAHGALVSLALPAFLALIFPLIIGFLLGPNALGGFLGGSIFTGVILALFMTNAGVLWENVKKYIEAGNYGGPGSESHRASMVGDTVGDPFKDAAGPSQNTFITVMALVSALFAPFIAAFHLF